MQEPVWGRRLQEWPCPCHSTASVAAQAPSPNIPVCKTLPSHTSSLSHTGSWPLPSSVLQAPHSNTQPPPMLADTHLKFGHAGRLHRPSVCVSVCLAYHRPAVVLSCEPPKLLSCPSWSPLLQVPPSGAGPQLFCLPFFFFFPLSHCLITWRSLLSFHVFEFLEFFCQCSVDVL